jgi:hypothetical protein
MESTHISPEAHPISQPSLDSSPIWTPIFEAQVLDYHSVQFRSYMGMFCYYVGIIQVSYLCNTYQYWFVCCYVLLYLGNFICSNLNPLYFLDLYVYHFPICDFKGHKIMT